MTMALLGLILFHWKTWKGEAGDAAATPTFSVGEDGHIYVQYGEDGEKTDLGVSTGGIYYVEDGVKLTIHIPNKDGEYEDIVLPRAASISSIKAVTVSSAAVLSEACRHRVDLW